LDGRFAALLCLGLLAAACGGGKEKTPTPAPLSPTATATAPRPSPSPAAEPTIDPASAGTAPVNVAGDALGGTLVDVRIGLHPELGGWDRIVFEFAGGLPSAQVQYVQSATQCGSGAPLALQGQAALAVRLQPAQAHNQQGQLTISSTTVPGQGGVIVEAKSYCDFEAVVQWAIGLKAQKPFKVTRLSDPPRLVIDVKQ
jgi:hypothetical protein